MASTPASAQALTLLAFADPDSGAWGVALPAAEPGLALAVAGGAPELRAAEIAADGDWSIQAGERTLTTGPRIPSARAADGDQDDGPSLASLQGDLSGGAAAFALPGGGFESVRLLAAWFPGGAAMALAATRPAGAKGHDRDAVTVAVAGEDPEVHVFDPRLSSTYNGDGTLRRAGIEMWLGKSEDDDLFPRRLAGEVSGPAGSLTGGGVSIEAYPLRCHASGEHGAGAYVLVRPA